MCRHLSFAMALVFMFASWALAAAAESFTDPAKAGPDFKIQGEYAGMIVTPDQELNVGAQLIALGDNKFRCVFLTGGLPGDGWQRGDPQWKAYSKAVDGELSFRHDSGGAKLVDGALTVFDEAGEALATLKKVERTSPTLGAKPPEGAKVLFDGSEDSLKNWTGGKIFGDDLLLAGTRGKDDLGDFTLHLEFRTPFVPKARGQARGNSGLYLQDRYECQILDSFGLAGYNNECGGFYQIKEPDVNMCFPPLAWQTYDIDFTGAKFDGEKKIANARVTVLHNGVPIHEDFELPNLTPGGAPTEFPGKGPLMLQAHGNPVTYRNIWVVEK